MRNILLCLILLFFVTTACGYKGDLYLPDPSKKEVKVKTKKTQQ